MRPLNRPTITSVPRTPQGTPQGTLPDRELIQQIPIPRGLLVPAIPLGSTPTANGPTLWARSGLGISEDHRLLIMPLKTSTRTSSHL